MRTLKTVQKRSERDNIDHELLPKKKVAYAEVHVKHC
jgi:hypothetical protein